MVTGLRPFTTYNLNVTASTAMGEGPPAMASERTSEAGEGEREREGGVRERGREGGREGGVREREGGMCGCGEWKPKLG